MMLTEFLLARIAEEEAVAREAQETGDGWWHDGDGEVWSHAQLVSHPTMVAHAVHIARHDPTYVLTNCEATRRIVEAEERTRTTLMRQAETYSLTLRLLALPYATHPDYREEWQV